MRDIQNPGSALGEAIGGHMEEALNTFLTETTRQLGYHFISRSPVLNVQGVRRKLLLHDKFGTAYNIDAVIANESMQPIVLVESKYIRYKKHNRDKGSWICTAHPAHPPTVSQRAQFDCCAGWQLEFIIFGNDEEFQYQPVSHSLSIHL